MKPLRQADWNGPVWSLNLPSSDEKPTLWLVITKKRTTGELYAPEELWIYKNQCPWISPCGLAVQWQPLDERFIEEDLVSALPIPLYPHWQALFPDSLVDLPKESGVYS